MGTLVFGANGFLNQVVKHGPDSIEKIIMFISSHEDSDEEISALDLFMELLSDLVYNQHLENNTNVVAISNIYRSGAFKEYYRIFPVFVPEGILYTLSEEYTNKVFNSDDYMDAVMEVVQMIHYIFDNPGSSDDESIEIFELKSYIWTCEQLVGYIPSMVI